MHAQQHAIRRVALAFAALVTAASLVAFQLTTFKSHYDTYVEKYRILRNLQELPSLRLHLSIKRDSMYVFGASQFDVSVKPVVAAAGVSYNGIVTFSDASTIHKYLLVDGAAYHVAETTQNESVVQKASCLAPSDLPPVHECGVRNGQTLQAGLLWGRLRLVLVARVWRARVQGLWLRSRHRAHVPERPAVITTPTLSAESAVFCEKVPSSSTAIAPSTADLLSGAAKDFSS